jgi:hypothetical protein
MEPVAVPDEGGSGTETLIAKANETKTKNETEN